MKGYEVLEVLSRIQPDAEIVLSPMGSHHFKATPNFEFQNPFCESKPVLLFDISDFGAEIEDIEKIEELKENHRLLRIRCRALLETAEIKKLRKNDLDDEIENLCGNIEELL